LGPRKREGKRETPAERYPNSKSRKRENQEMIKRSISRSAA